MDANLGPAGLPHQQAAEAQRKGGLRRCRALAFARHNVAPSAEDARGRS
jgi:hypothetical protein